MRKKRKLRARTGGAEGADEPGEGASASELDVDEAAGDEPGGDEAAELESDAELDPDAELEADPELDPDAGLEPVQAGEVDGDADVSGGADDGELGGDPDAELSPAFSLDPDRLKSILESLLFAAEKPLSPVDLRRLTGCDDTAAIQAALDRLMQEYEQRGVALYDVAGGYQFRTHPANSEYVQRLIAGRPVRLSRAQLETLAIIAYRQPVTRPEIDEIRGVDSGSTLKVLIDRSLIRVLGKKEEPGRPLLYGTSKEFLEFFNLRELRDLPSLREFSELTEESLREVEALDQAGKEEAGDEAGAAAGGNGAGDDGDDEADDDSSSAAATH